MQVYTCVVDIQLYYGSRAERHDFLLSLEFKTRFRKLLDAAEI